MAYSRDYEQRLLERIREYGISDTTILEHILDWLDSDRSCEALEDFISDNDL